MNFMVNFNVWNTNEFLFPLLLVNFPFLVLTPFLLSFFLVNIHTDSYSNSSAFSTSIQFLCFNLLFPHSCWSHLVHFLPSFTLILIPSLISPPLSPSPDSTATYFCSVLCSNFRCQVPYFHLFSHPAPFNLSWHPSFSIFCSSVRATEHLWCKPHFSQQKLLKNNYNWLVA